MPQINLLSKDISELIAAGEVIERPASVIKELLENSIDAGAKHITVEIKNGGTTYMRITDDGCGIAENQVATAFLRHATSKIISKDDLENILTLGFRGEALASICAVAKVEVLTKQKEDELGTNYIIEGGVEKLCEATGCPDGTTIIIRDIFFNVPVRQKFMKRDSAEANAISSIMQKIVLSHPDISFKLIKDNKVEFNSAGDGELLSAIYGVYGRDFAHDLIPVDYNENGITVKGYVIKPLYSKANRSFQNFFINGRYVKSVTCCVSLEEAYKNLVMQGKYPACVLMLELPPATVDVNIHPAKAEVRFSDEKLVFNCMYFAVKNALMASGLIYDFQLREEKKSEQYYKAKPFEPEKFNQPTLSEIDTENHDANGTNQIKKPFELEKSGQPTLSEIDNENHNANGTNQIKKPFEQEKSGQPTLSEIDTENHDANGTNQIKKPFEQEKSGQPTLSEIDNENHNVNGTNQIKKPFELEKSGQPMFSEQKNIGVDVENNAHTEIANTTETAKKESIVLGETEKNINQFNHIIKPVSMSEYGVPMTDNSVAVKKAETQNGNYSFASSKVMYDSSVKIVVDCEDVEDEQHEITEESLGGFSYISKKSFEKKQPEPQMSVEKKQDEITVIGEIFKNYILAQSDENMVIIDKHAAHERVIFERLRAGCKSSDSQILMTQPKILLSEKECNAVAENMDILESMGFKLDIENTSFVKVMAVPVILQELNTDEIIPEIAENLYLNKVNPQTSRLDDMLHDLACKAAIKAGDKNKTQELQALAEEVFYNENIRHCPHGRPIMFILSKRDIEKQFKRIL